MDIIRDIKTFGDNVFLNIPSGEFVINLKQGEVRNCYIIQAYGENETVAVDYKISLAEDSHLNLVVTSVFGKSITNNFEVVLAGEHSECNLSGLYLIDGNQFVENNIILNHDAAKCNSNQLFKGIVDQNGISKFYGLIKVAPDSQKTEAYQANHNLLMSDDAKAFTKPQLEIYADDVKCSHGATIGKLDEEEAFYLRSRGITEGESATLLQIAFISEVIEKIPDKSLQEEIRQIVENRLGKQ